MSSDDARDVLIDVVIDHPFEDIGRCGCGWTDGYFSHGAHLADAILAALKDAGYTVGRFEPITVDNDDGAGGMWIDKDGNRQSYSRPSTKRVVGYRLLPDQKVEDR